MLWSIKYDMSKCRNVNHANCLIHGPQTAKQTTKSSKMYSLVQVCEYLFVCFTTWTRNRYRETTCSTS